VCTVTSDGIASNAAAIVLRTVSLCYEARLPDESRDSGTSHLIVGSSLVEGATFADQFSETFRSDPFGHLSLRA
jgi:hypothetical protein